MNPFNKFIWILAAALIPFGVYADDDEDCENKDPCEGLSGEELEKCRCQNGGGGNPVMFYSGNVVREIPDMELAVQVGEHPLALNRTFTSRPEWAVRPRNDFYFGEAGNWRHSYQWTILDDGETGFGGQKLQVISPSSDSSFYHKKESNDLFMTSSPKAHARILPDGTNYYLYYLDGTRYHITEHADVETNKTYRMEGFSDPYSNWYGFAYNTNGMLARVHGPNTNHHFTFEYSDLTNSVDSGWVRFTFDDTNAVQVFVPGTWYGWTTNWVEMAFTNGQWEADVELTNGFYEYKFVARYTGDTNDYWYTDPDNDIAVGPNSNSVAVVDPYKLISKVVGSDGREVSYSYGWGYNENNVLDITLAGANYDGEYDATYTYYPAEYDQSRMTLLQSADDPHYDKVGRSIWYNYNTNGNYSGKLYEERHLVTSQLLARLVYESGEPGESLRYFTGPGGSTSVYSYAVSNANWFIQTNGAGEVTKREYYGDNGMLWKETDALGRTTEYFRTWHFGAVTSVVNNTCGCSPDGTTTFTDDTYPFHPSSETSKGRTTTYTRDAFYRPTRIDYEDGTYQTFAYNEHGQVLTNRQQDGAIWEYEYDFLGRKTRTIDPSGAETMYAYDGYNRMSSETNDLGSATHYGYNWRGQNTETTYEDNTKVISQYSVYGLMTQVVSRSFGTNSISYDALGNIASWQTASGATTTYGHRPDGFRLFETTPLGMTVSNEYDAIGRMVKQWYSSDNTYIQWKHGMDGVATQVNRLGYSTITEYTEDGQIQKVIDPLLGETSYAYDENDNRTHMTNALGDSTSYIYDSMGRVIRIDASCSGMVSSNTYDGVGRIVSQTDAEGHTTHHSYDLLGRRTGTSKNGLQLNSNIYNSVGMLVGRVNAEGLLTTNLLDNVGRVLVTYLPDGSTSSNTYEGIFVKSSYDRGGRETTYERDVSGRVTNQVDNATNSVKFQYDVVGNLTNLIDQAGTPTAFTYDEEGRKTAKRYQDGTENLYTYDSLGQLASRDMEGVVTYYHYDKIGNLTNIDYQSDSDVYFTYDKLGRQTSMEDAVGVTTNSYVDSCSGVGIVDGPFANDSVEYTYDSMQRISSITSGATLVEYSYDPLGRIETVVARNQTNSFNWLGNGRQLESATRGNGTVVDYSYDSINRLTNVHNRNGAGSITLASYRYVLDDSDLRQKVQYEDGREVDYTYDPVGQLLGADGDFSGYHYAFEYDETGNPVVQDRNGYILTNEFNALNQSVTSDWSGVAFVLGVVNMTDGVVIVEGQTASQRNAYPNSYENIFSATNLTVVGGSNSFDAVLEDPFERSVTSSVEFTTMDHGHFYDERGSLTNDMVFGYTFNDENRLVQVVRLSNTSMVMTCSYDGLGRRREKVTYDAGGLTNRYVFGDGRLAWAVLNITDGSDSLLEDYTHGPDISGGLGGAGGVCGLLSVQTWTGGVEDVLGYYHYDGNGNVVMVSGSDEGAIVKYEYSPFGAVISRAGDVSLRYQFSSKEYDEGACLNYFGYRYYSPQLGRWVNRDPYFEVSHYVKQPEEQVEQKSRSGSCANKRAWGSGVKSEGVAQYSEDLLPHSLYLFSDNNPINKYDILGLKPGTGGGGCVLSYNGCSDTGCSLKMGGYRCIYASKKNACGITEKSCNCNKYTK